MDEEDNSVLGQLRRSVSEEGFEEAKPEFGRRLHQLQVQKCREMRGYTSCQECPANDVCTLYIITKREQHGIFD